ncbi:CYTH domain-containing protein [Pseudotenacibaculum sp. MALMAid0570]|uniref:CYTH domain-containing protein n=1 Tax=Pseudotenacibaculum sp. MALMAid0570 TaxID=3143938 RepID=UPI0032DE73FF
MSVEIERKFLVINSDFEKLSNQKKYIKQGFLNSDKNRVVRIRIIDDTAFLTIKGISNSSGTTRFEWEQEISVSEAQDLMTLCEPGIIEKHRYYHKIGKHIFEIDVFLGDNKGLILAEVELSHEKEVFETPSYLGNEVTGQEKYYNSNLCKSPFQKWV